jgi:hypothetical protein
LTDELKRAVNFEIEPPKKLRADVCLDKALQSIIVSSLIKKNRSKNKQLVDENFHENRIEEEFDKKEFDYCRK